jgi:hypothetical protein
MRFVRMGAVALTSTVIASFITNLTFSNFYFCFFIALGVCGLLELTFMLGERPEREGE